MTREWGLTMNPSIVTNAVIALLVVGLLLYRQLTPREVKTDGSWRFLVIIGLIGLVQLGQFVENSAGIGVLGVGLLVVSLGLAAVFGAIRAASVTIWQQADGSWWRRGGAITLGLWLVSICSHFGVDALAVQLAGPEVDMQGLGNASLLLYVAISLGLQNMLVARRVAIRDRAERALTLRF